MNISDLNIDIPFQFNNYDLVANITCSYYYIPAKLDGAWENCYPVEEEFEYELNELSFDGLEQIDTLSKTEQCNIIIGADEFLESEQERCDYVKELALDVYNTNIDYG